MSVRWGGRGWGTSPGQDTGLSQMGLSTLSSPTSSGRVHVGPHCVPYSHRQEVKTLMAVPLYRGSRQLYQI